MTGNLVTTRDAAASLGVSVSTISRLVARGDLAPVVKIAGKRGAFLFNPDDVAELAKERSPA